MRILTPAQLDIIIGRTDCRIVDNWSDALSETELQPLCDAINAWCRGDVQAIRLPQSSLESGDV